MALRVLPPLSVLLDNPLPPVAKTVFSKSSNQRYTSGDNSTPNPYSSRVKVWNSANVFYNGNVYEFSPTTFPRRAMTPDLARVYSKLIDKWQQTDFNAGVALGESRESVSLILTRLMQLRKFVQHLRGGNLSAAIGNLKLSGRQRSTISKEFSGASITIADLILELKFGWIPILQDIYDASQYCELKPIENRLRAHVTASESKSSVYGSNIFYSTETQKSRTVYAVSCVVGRKPLDFQRLGLSDPAVFWELVPYSFLVDYIFPIKSIIRSTFVLPQMQAKYPCRTIFKRSIATYKDIRRSATPGQKPVDEVYPYPSTVHVDVDRYTNFNLPSILDSITPKSHVSNDVWVSRLDTSVALLIKNLQHPGNFRKFNHRGNSNVGISSHYTE